MHAAGSPDPSRSHFDAQDYMESGVPGQKYTSSGWLNRLVTELPSTNSPVQAISIGPLLPRIFAGPSTIATVDRVAAPTRTALDNETVGGLFGSMYGARNDQMGKAFNEGMQAHKNINESLSAPVPQDSTIYKNPDDKQEQIAANRGAPQPKSYSNFGKQLANLFLRDDSVQVAFLDFGGWDTHIRQGNGKGPLADKLGTLSTGLADLAAGLGKLYEDSAIVVVSEFGRTAKENGNGGTDHGHGNAIWLMGGGISGGQVFGRWGGLAPADLHEQRDLPVNSDFRAVLSRCLGDHMHLSHSALARIFPDFKDTVNPFVTT